MTEAKTQLLWLKKLDMDKRNNNNLVEIEEHLKVTWVTASTNIQRIFST